MKTAVQVTSAGLWLIAALPVAAQVTATPAEEVSELMDQEPAGEPYTYNPAGRRDPFVSLQSRGVETPLGVRPAGLAGLLVDEAAVSGIVETPGGTVAIIRGSDDRTYIVRPDDRLLDGTVKEIAPDAVIFSQEVKDPLSLVKQREVRKPLRPGEEDH